MASDGLFGLLLRSEQANESKRIVNPYGMCNYYPPTPCVMISSIVAVQYIAHTRSLTRSQYVVFVSLSKHSAQYFMDNNIL